MVRHARRHAPQSWRCAPEGTAQTEELAVVEIRLQKLNPTQSGLNTPPAEMPIKLADALDGTVDFLLHRQPGGGESPRSNLRRCKCLQVPEARDTDEIIDAMIAKPPMAAAIAPVDAAR